MSISPVSVCNQALAHLGDRRITRLDKDAATSDALVGYCLEFYEQAKAEVMAAQQWSFAKHVVGVSQRTDTLVIGFKYAHELPPDHLRLIRLYQGTFDENTPGATVVYDAHFAVDKFKIVSTQVWSNVKYLAIEYIRDLNDPDDWTPHFRAAVARLLAAYLAGPTSDNPDESTKQMRIYETIALPNAQYYDAVQDQSGENSDMTTRLAESPSLRSRYSLQYGATNPSDLV